MTMLLDAEVGCIKCGKTFNTKLYRLIWLEYEKNLNLVLNGSLNNLKCPHCQTSFYADLSVLCTNIQKSYAVWYEPYADKYVDDEIRKYKAGFGEHSFYAKAKRIREMDHLISHIMKAEQSNTAKPIQASPHLFELALNKITNRQLPKEINSSTYPKWLSLMIDYKSLHKTCLYLIALFFLCISYLVGKFPNVELGLFFDLAIVYIFFYVITGTLGYVIALDYKPWKNRSKIFKMYFFITGLYGLITLFYHKSLDIRNIEDFIMNFILPTIIGGLACYIYKKFIE